MWKPGQPDATSRNRLLRNDGDFTFADIGGALGVDDGKKSYQPVLTDLSGDGWLDIAVAEDKRGGMTYYQSQGDGTFVDRTDESGMDGVHSQGFKIDGMGIGLGDYAEGHFASGRTRSTASVIRIGPGERYQGVASSVHPLALAALLSASTACRPVPLDLASPVAAKPLIVDAEVGAPILPELTVELPPPDAPVLLVRNGETVTTDAGIEIWVDETAELELWLYVDGNQIDFLHQDATVGWTTWYRIEHVSTDYWQGTVEIRCWRITEEVFRTQTFHLERGESFDVDPWLLYRFEGGAMVSDYSDGGLSRFVENWSYAVSDPFQINNHRFTVLSDDGDFVELRVETLALKPVSVSSPGCGGGEGGGATQGGRTSGCR